ncbi:hypothetical protein HJFPF1_08178 [Paramyrothecium foliicola]|nr:hypothetical protein HJFPF1_08178 [Paramyrothecium foliicola]
MCTSVIKANLVPGILRTTRGYDYVPQNSSNEVASRKGFNREGKRVFEMALNGISYHFVVDDRAKLPPPVCDMDRKET